MPDPPPNSTPSSSTLSTPQKMLSAVQRQPPSNLSGTPIGKTNAGASTSRGSSAWKPMTPKRDRSDIDESPASKSKKAKRKGGKACVYCRRSHMVCEGGRPCERCVKRDIAHLCRDVTPPSSAKKEGEGGSSLPDIKTEPSLPPPQAALQAHSQAPVYDSSASWPLLPDANPTAGVIPDTIDLSAISREANGVAGGGWGVAENAEFGILSDMLKTLRVPTLPGGFVDVLSQVVRNTGTNGPQVPQITAPKANGSSNSNGDTDGNGNGNGSVVSGETKSKGKGKGKAKAKNEPFTTVSRIEQYLLAAADQPDGSRASRLTQVIRAKYEAGLLKPYDYIKGYERMNRWMDSGRAARVEGSSRSSSPTKGGPKRLVVPPPPSGSSISPESRRRILAALEAFRPRFRRIAKELTDLDLVFVEEANERLMLQYDRALASIHTPSCIWRRTGEIQKANQEFAKLTGIPAPLFRNGQLCVYELMDEDSAVRFWEGYGKVAFEKGQSHMYMHCTLKIPLSLTRAQPSRTQNNTPAHPPVVSSTNVPELALPQSLAMTAMGSSSGQSNQSIHLEEEYRVIKTCFSITIRRDRYEIPVAIMGQWIPIV